MSMPLISLLPWNKHKNSLIPDMFDHLAIFLLECLVRLLHDENIFNLSSQTLLWEKAVPTLPVMVDIRLSVGFGWQEIKVCHCICISMYWMEGDVVPMSCFHHQGWYHWHWADNFGVGKMIGAVHGVCSFTYCPWLKHCFSFTILLDFIMVSSLVLLSRYLIL